MTRKRRGRRTRIGKGLYRDSYGLAAAVKVGTGLEAVQREKRFAFDTSHKEMRAWQDATRAELRARQRRPVAVRGTLADDVTRYLGQVLHLASYKSRVCEVHAWTDLFGRLRRAQLTAAHVREARGRWLAADYAPKTINNRVQTLRHVYHVLDGRRAPTPADEVVALLVPPTPKVNLQPSLFRTVAAQLDDARTRARFMVIASTGVRPAEVKRAELQDVDLERRLWFVRTAKGGDLAQRGHVRGVEGVRGG